MCAAGTTGAAGPLGRQAGSVARCQRYFPDHLEVDVQLNRFPRARIVGA
jgi:hypothetical protein